MSIPKPGKPVRGSNTGRPIMALLDFLGRRWVLRILWELRETPATFRELRDRCDDMSPTVLNQRLKDLRDADIVIILEAGGYGLSPSGRLLLKALKPLALWASDWQENLASKDTEGRRSTK